MKLESFAEQMKQLNAEASRFAEKYPEQAQLLNLNALQDKDPYVERLLEGTAFLTAQIKERIDADLPEISGTFVQQFWPHISKPFPSVCMLQFQHKLRQLQSTQVIEKGTELLTEALGPESTTCRFTTTQDLSVLPLHLIDAQITQLNSGTRKISLAFQVEPGIDLNKLDFNNFKAYVNADEFHVAPLLYALTDDNNKVSINFSETSQSQKNQQRLPAQTISLASLQQEAMLLPEFGREQFAFHLLLEYFACKVKYQFVQFNDLNKINFPKVCQSFSIDIETDADIPNRIQLNADNILLHCVPAINLYQQTAEPINCEHFTSEYDLLINCRKPNSELAYAVESLTAIDAVTGDRQTVDELYSFSHRDDIKAYYSTQEKINFNNQLEIKLSVGELDHDHKQRLSCNAWVYNGDYPRRYLGENELTQTSSAISFGKFTNITRPTSVLAPKALEDLHWSLIKYLNFNFQTINTLPGLVSLLRNFDWSQKADNKKRIEGIKNLTTTPINTIMQAALFSGTEVRLLLDDEAFSSLGDAYLFAKLLSEFFFCYADVNNFIQVKVDFVKGHQQWLWRQKI